MIDFHRKPVVIVFLFGALFLTCTVISTRDLLKIHLEMSKTDVQSVLEEPVTVRESLTNMYGQIVEVWEYELYKPNHERPTKYWLYFHDDVLVKWCEGGGERQWKAEADKVYQMKFK